MSLFTKTKISTAADSRHPHTFGSQHVTTSDFFQISPVYARELIPKSSIKVDCRPFARMASMPVPTFGSADLNLRAFFVPFRTVFPAWEDFITDAMHTNAGSFQTQLVQKVPTITNKGLLDLLASSDLSNRVRTADFSSSASDAYGWSDYDFGYKFVTSSSNIKYYCLRFTPLGRQVFKILQSLGYNVLPDNTLNVEFSALPLLCFFRAYFDWYYPAQYFGDTSTSILEGIFKRDAPPQGAIAYTTLLEAFKICSFVSYGEDYFTSAFESPVGPVNNHSSDGGALLGNEYTYLSDQTARKDPNTPASQVVNVNESTNATDYYNNVPVITRDGQQGGQLDQNTPIVSISQFVLDSLKRLTDYMKRHQLAGARSFERFAARFGVELKSKYNNRSIMLSSHKSPMMVQDVFSTADTEGAGLADYAGKGFIPSQDCSFSFDNGEDYGYFIILSSIVPDTPVYQGIDRSVCHIRKLDFFTPEFDSLGCQTIRKDEVFVPSVRGFFSADADSWSPDRWDNLHDGIFGFTPRYAEYKVPRNQITGDFRLMSHQVGDTSPSWHLFRTFSNASFVNGASDLVHSKSFIKPYAQFSPASDPSELDGMTYGQYNRIFDNATSSADHFYLQYFFRTRLIMPAKPLFDTYDFADEQEHGSTIINVNGARVN